MKTFRQLALVIFFSGLAALEIAHGIYRLHTVRERSRNELMETIERGQSDLAATLRNILEGQRAHARYLSSMPLLRSFLSEHANRDPRLRKQLESDLLAYLLSFGSIDRIRILGTDGRELVRCERIGREGGVGALPRPLLERQPDEDMLALARRLPPGDVLHTTLMVDRRRVEVPESERQVIHYVTGVDVPGIRDTKEERIGLVVLTVYAAPLLTFVREFAPIAGVLPFLVDEDGSYLAHADRAHERGGHAETNLLRDFPTAARSILSGSERADTPDIRLLSRAVSEDPQWHFVVAVPDAALEAASGGLRVEYLWVIGSVGAITLLLAGAAIFFVRLSARELELREAQRRKEMERRLQISERLSALGMLTAGVAHEINNPLEGIGNYLSLLERDSLPPERRARYLHLVRHGFHRIRDIVRDLSDLARPRNGREGGTADISQVVERAVKLAAYDDRFKEVRVRLAGLDAPLRVPGDAGRLEQVVLNLLLNAGRAMNGKGTVWVRARLGRGAGGIEEETVELAVEDEGPGIAPEDLSRLFDPFFTTTDGTGLGLAISHSIVSAHGGTLAAENRDEGGARFVIQLPAGQSAKAPGEG